jgi:hypothetical protein
MNYDGQELTRGFQDAVTRYNQAHPSPAYTQDSLGQLDALVWLKEYQGPDHDRVASKYVTGGEQQLFQQIKDTLTARIQNGTTPARLSPGDVFGLALGISEGNINNALLTAHNTLRALARGDASVGVPQDPTFVNTYLVQLRSDEENGGPWYHVYGTAYMATVVQGDWGPWVLGGAGVLGYATGLFSGGFGALLTGGGLAYLRHNSGASDQYNELEQYYRESVRGGGQLPDPEKFCFNVWGAQIGATLYKSSPYKKIQVEPLPPPLGPQIRSASFPVPPPVTDEPDFADPLTHSRFVNSIGSPFSIEWRDGAAAMVLDQGSSLATASVYGGVPMFFWPTQEQDSWGVLWVSPEQRPQQVTFAATTPGAQLHYVRADITNGQFARYDATATRTGERFTMTLDSTTLAPILRRDDGTQIQPQLGPATVPAPSANQIGWPWPFVIAAIGATVAALLAGVVLMRRRLAKREP